MLSLSITRSYGVIFVNNNTSNRAAFNTMYPFILHSSSIPIYNGRVIFYQRYSGKGTKYYFGSESDKLNSILNSMSTFKYSEGQNDPSKLDTLGGNCQALTLYLCFTCKRNNISSTIEFMDNHMYNKIYAQDYTLSVDLANNKISREEK